MARRLLQTENKIRKRGLALEWISVARPLSLGQGVIKKDSEYVQVLRKVAEEKESLLPSLPPELQKGIENLLDVQMEAAVISERDAFVMGFRLAV